jgi:hypothetical protein
MSGKCGWQCAVQQCDIAQVLPPRNFSFLPNALASPTCPTHSTRATISRRDKQCGNKSWCCTVCLVHILRRNTGTCTCTFRFGPVAQQEKGEGKRRGKEERGVEEVGKRGEGKREEESAFKPRRSYTLRLAALRNELLCTTLSHTSLRGSSGDLACNSASPASCPYMWRRGCCAGAGESGNWIFALLAVDASCCFLRFAASFLPAVNVCCSFPFRALRLDPP